MSMFFMNDYGRIWGRLSLTRRLALIFALVSAGLLLVLGVLISAAVDRHFDELDEHDLKAKLAVIELLTSRVHDAETLDDLPRRLRDALVGHENISVLLRDADDSAIFGFNIDAFYPAQISGLQSIHEQRWTKGDRTHTGFEKNLVLSTPQPLPIDVLVALDISHHVHFLSQLQRSLWLAILLAMVFAGLLGGMAAKKGLESLRPIEAMAANLSPQKLTERVPETHGPVEVRGLTDAFNKMLDRLENTFKRLTDYSADIAHELRTPISNLTMATQVALSKDRTESQYREFLQSNLEEFERMTRMVSDMLFLAQVDSQVLSERFESVDLAIEAEKLAIFYEALAEEKGVRIECQGTAAIRGDRLMLRRAISNLLSNAIRHCYPNGRIGIDIERQTSWVLLKVSNPGQPIAHHEISRIFDRFHRIQGASTQGEGAGLGLAITQSIARSHGGFVDATCDGGITTFIIRLPA